MNKTTGARTGSNGRLPHARWLPSPNFDARPDPADISLLVIHNISLPPGKFGGDYVEQLFLNRLNPREHPFFETLKTLRVSSHLFINRRGQLTQFVDLHQRAWHAGQSVYAGRERCNDFSIGIELEGTDDRPFTAAQYRRLASVTRRLLRQFPKLSRRRIAGHSDIAPGRKTDPGPHFDWPRYQRELAS